MSEKNRSSVVKIKRVRHINQFEPLTTTATYKIIKTLIALIDADIKLELAT